MAEISPATILFTGAKIWEGSHNFSHVENAIHAKWVSNDIEDGDEVDVVCDLQRLDIDTSEKYEGIFSPATLEHVERPWLAIHAMSNCLNPGGVLFIHTHQTFPLHGYPHDYFRFSAEALKLMCSDSGLQVVETSYDCPCKIVPPSFVNDWNEDAESFLNVSICAVKPK